MIFFFFIIILPGSGKLPSTNHVVTKSKQKQASKIHEAGTQT